VSWHRDVHADTCGSSANLRELPPGPKRDWPARYLSVPGGGSGDSWLSACCLVLPAVEFGADPASSRPHGPGGAMGETTPQLVPAQLRAGGIVSSRWMSWGPASQPGGPDGGLMVRRFGGSSPPPRCSPRSEDISVRPFHGCPRATQRSTRESDRLEQPHGSIRMEPRMARISATSFRGEAGDQFASIIRRVPSTSRIQNSSLRPGSPL
jgi:hypothetical protein